MIACNEFSNVPLRQGNADACLLASYGAAQFPFTRTAEIEYFISLCNLLGIALSNPGDALASLEPQRVDPRISVLRNGSGYDWIETLHNDANAVPFDTARSTTTIDRTLTTVQLEKELKDRRCTAIVSLHEPGTGLAHSIALACDSAIGFFARDSGRLVSGPMPTIDATGDSIAGVVHSLYPTRGLRIGESMLIRPL